MKANAPEKIFIQSFNVSEENAKFDKSKMFFDDVWTEEPELGQENIEYTRTDSFIEKACEYWYQYNQDIVKGHSKKHILGRGVFTVNVEDFKRYLKGE